MNKLLEKAFAEASKLSEVEQNALAKWLLDELEEDKKWDKTLAESEDVLDKLADKAIKLNKQCETQSLNVNDL